jgi:hypothetical protein
MFYREGERRSVDIDSMYYWKIGRPEETLPPERIKDYRIGATSVYRRRFSVIPPVRRFRASAEMNSTPLRVLMVGVPARRIAACAAGLSFSGQ